MTHAHTTRPPHNVAQTFRSANRKEEHTQTPPQAGLKPCATSPGALEQTGLYVYCIAGPISSPPPPSQPSVYPIRCGPLSALVADVALDEFSPETLTAHQDDVRWLAERVKLHNDVIREAMRHTTILPLRFGTIFTSHDTLLEFLTERHPLFTRLLEKFEGRQEWGAKLFHSSSQRSAGSRQGTALNQSGRDFLLRKRQQHLAKERAKTEAIARAAELHHCLSRHTVSSVAHNRSPYTKADPHTSLIFSASYLVDNDRLPSFLEAAEEFATNVSPHFQATVSGPWPPYSFVSDVGASVQSSGRTPDTPTGVINHAPTGQLEDTSKPLQQQSADPKDSSDDRPTEWEAKDV